MAKISNYEILNVIGSGTYATVHKGIDKRTRQIVAIKTIERKKILKAKFSIDNLIQGKINFILFSNHSITWGDCFNRD